MKRMGLIVALFLVIFSTLFVVGCRPELPLSDLPTLNNDLANGKLTIDKVVPGEDFSFVREYSTSYDAKSWRITDSKNLMMRAWVRGAPRGMIVLVEHMHSDVSLKSRYEGLDGWPQDSMDDSVHGGDQPGFWVTESYPYENVFAIEGFSQSLIEGWGYWGTGYIGSYRLTETNVVQYGKVYGNKIQVVYDLLIKRADEQYFHTRSVIDEFLVPTGVQPDTN